MRSPFFKGVLLGAIVAAVVTITATAFAGTGIGAVFNLGKANTANRTTALAGKTSGAILAVTNRGTGPALGISVQSGKAPLLVNSRTKVKNLDADSVDGLHVFSSAPALVTPTSGADLFVVDGFGAFRVEHSSNPLRPDWTFVFMSSFPQNVTIGDTVVAPGETFSDSSGTKTLLLSAARRLVVVDIYTPRLDADGVSVWVAATALDFRQ